MILFLQSVKDWFRMYDLIFLAGPRRGEAIFVL